MAQPVNGWQEVLFQLPLTGVGHWAVTGSAALALQGVAIEPRDVDILADDSAGSAMSNRLASLVVRDEVGWNRGDVRAARRTLAIVAGYELEILVGVEAYSDGIIQLGTPDLSHVDLVIVGGMEIPVLPLSTLIPIMEATGHHERAAMARSELSRRNLHG